MFLRPCIIIGSLLLVSGCTGDTVVALPSEQVLEHAADAVHDLSSVAFHATANVDGLLPGAGEVQIVSDGVMQDGGQQMAFTLNATMDDVQTGHDSSIGADIVVAGDDELYLRLKSLKGDIPAAFFGSGVPPTGVWWQLPSAQDTDTPAAVFSPDPALLRAQAQVVTVERDRGIQNGDGHPSYYYDTVVDTEKLRAYLEEVAVARGDTFDPDAFAQSWARLSIRGVLVIDARTFFVRRIDWTFVPADGKDGLRGTISVVLTDHNTAKPVAPPPDAVPSPWGKLPAFPLS